MVWKGKEFAEQLMGDLGQYIQYRQGTQAANMTRDFRGIIFNVFVCTFGQYIKDLDLEEADAEATLPNWSQNFLRNTFFPSQT